MVENDSIDESYHSDLQREMKQREKSSYRLCFRQLTSFALSLSSDRCVSVKTYKTLPVCVAVMKEHFVFYFLGLSIE